MFSVQCIYRNRHLEIESSSLIRDSSCPLYVFLGSSDVLHVHGGRRTRRLRDHAARVARAQSRFAHQTRSRGSGKSEELYRPADFRSLDMLKTRERVTIR